MQSQFDDLDIFCAVAQFGSFYKASRHLSIPHSTVSRRVASLEQQLSIQLIVRTTRQMRLTDKGKLLFEQVSPLMNQLKVAISESIDDDDDLKGPMKVTMPTRIGLDHMADILLEFNQLHPKLELNIELQNENSDLVKENIDLAFRVGPLVDSSAIAMRLWDIEFKLLVHQDLVSEYAVSCQQFQLKSLAQVPCIVAHPQTRWLFEHTEQGHISVLPNPTIQVNDLSIALKAAQKGLGFAYLPDIVVRNSPDNTDLVEISCSQWRPLTRTLYALYTANRTSSRKIKAVIDYVKTAYQQRIKDEKKDD